MKHKIVKYLAEYTSELVVGAILLFENNDEALLYVSLDKNNFFNHSYDFVCRAKLCKWFEQPTYVSFNLDQDFPIHKIKSEQDIKNIIKAFDIEQEINYLHGLKVFK